MSEPVPSYFSHDVNRRVVAHVAPLSAHSDIADVLVTAVQPLGDVQIYCPNPRQYRYVTVSTKGVIFGVALGVAFWARKAYGYARESAI
jgi:hypothetical protein